ncbi:MAG: DUF421 domain-containing protein, partial [Oscillospiraceae bacterium]
MTAVVLRTLLVYVLVIAAVRLMGKRQIGELCPSELVTTILISNLASLPVEEINLPLATSIMPILVIVSIEIILSVVAIKVPGVSRLLSG